jgi:hypothetical protein
VGIGNQSRHLDSCATRCKFFYHVDLTPNHSAWILTIGIDMELRWKSKCFPINLTLMKRIHIHYSKSDRWFWAMAGFLYNIVMFILAASCSWERQAFPLLILSTSIWGVVFSGLSAMPSFGESSLVFDVIIGIPLSLFAVLSFLSFWPLAFYLVTSSQSEIRRRAMILVSSYFVVAVLWLLVVSIYDGNPFRYLRPGVYVIWLAVFIPGQIWFWKTYRRFEWISHHES